MKTTVYERLMISEEEYEMMIMQIWLNWCHQKSRHGSRKSLQKVLACVPLFNWWKRELQKLENEFIQSTIPFQNPVHAKRMYCEFTVEIFGKFSRPLLNQAYKNDKN